MAVLDLHCCVDFSLVAVSRGSSAVVVHGFLIALASLLVEHGLWDVQASAVGALGLSSWGSWAAQHRLSNCGAHDTWALPRSGTEPVSPALAGRPSHFFLRLNIPSFGGATVYTFTYWRTPWLLANFGNYEKRCYKHFKHKFLCRCSSQLLWVNAKNCDWPMPTFPSPCTKIPWQSMHSTPYI